MALMGTISEPILERVIFYYFSEPLLERSIDFYGDSVAFTFITDKRLLM